MLFACKETEALPEIYNFGKASLLRVIRAARQILDVKFLADLCEQGHLEGKHL